jgi:hypothetical protein
MDGWMDGHLMLLLLLLTRNKLRFYPALPKPPPTKKKQEAVTKHSRSAQHFFLSSPLNLSSRLGKERKVDGGSMHGLVEDGCSCRPWP